ncbi:hypothetical protein QTP70_034190, partial [Hemibagrus guttatus]
ELSTFLSPESRVPASPPVRFFFRRGGASHDVTGCRGGPRRSHWQPGDALRASRRSPALCAQPRADCTRASLRSPPTPDQYTGKIRRRRGSRNRKHTHPRQVSEKIRNNLTFEKESINNALGLDTQTWSARDFQCWREGWRRL